MSALGPPRPSRTGDRAALRPPAASRMGASPSSRRPSPPPTRSWPSSRRPWSLSRQLRLRRRSSSPLRKRSRRQKLQSAAASPSARGWVRLGSGGSQADRGQGPGVRRCFRGGPGAPCQIRTGARAQVPRALGPRNRVRSLEGSSTGQSGRAGDRGQGGLELPRAGVQHRRPSRRLREILGGAVSACDAGGAAPGGCADGATCSRSRSRSRSQAACRRGGRWGDSCESVDSAWVPSARALPRWNRTLAGAGRRRLAGEEEGQEGQGVAERLVLDLTLDDTPVADSPQGAGSAPWGVSPTQPWPPPLIHSHEGREHAKVLSGSNACCLGPPARCDAFTQTAVVIFIVVNTPLYGVYTPLSSLTIELRVPASLSLSCALRVPPLSAREEVAMTPILRLVARSRARVARRSGASASCTPPEALRSLLACRSVACGPLWLMSWKLVCLGAPLSSDCEMVWGHFLPRHRAGSAPSTSRRRGGLGVFLYPPSRRPRVHTRALLSWSLLRLAPRRASRSLNQPQRASVSHPRLVGKL